MPSLRQVFATRRSSWHQRIEVGAVCQRLPTPGRGLWVQHSSSVGVFNSFRHPTLERLERKLAMTNKRMIALQKFVRSINRRLIKPTPNETPAERGYRVASEILMRIELWDDAGLSTRRQRMKDETLYYQVKSRQCEYLAEIRAARRKANP